MNDATNDKGKDNASPGTSDDPVAVEPVPFIAKLTWIELPNRFDPEFPLRVYSVAKDGQ